MVLVPDDLQRAFAEFGDDAASRSPLYRVLSARCAAEPTVLQLLAAAPPTQQRPVLLFAAVHSLLLDGADHTLRRHYPNLSGVAFEGRNPAAARDAGDAFVDFVHSHRDQLIALVSTRSTQTNEVGRCATFLPAFGMIAGEVGRLAHVDVGTSAGLTLLLPRLSYRYTSDDGTRTTLGPREAASDALEVVCEARGPVPVPSGLPDITWSVGLDPDPIDVGTPEEASWLEACVWPDQTERFARLVAAIDLAGKVGVDVRRGDARHDLVPLVEDAARTGAHPVVTTSWVMCYLDRAGREQVVSALDSLGRHLDFTWVVAEAPSQTAGLPIPMRGDREEITVLSAIRWRSGRRTVHRLATAHPHGATLRWEAGAPTSSRWE